MKLALTEAAEVAGAAGRLFARMGHLVAGMPLDRFAHGPLPEAVAGLPVVVVAERKRAEIVAEEPAGLEALAATVRRLDHLGWNVVVLIPVGLLGEAHRLLRGAPCLLQPWWGRGDALEFGGPEIP